jgi:hypothetical protein
VRKKRSIATSCIQGVLQFCQNLSKILIFTANKLNLKDRWLKIFGWLVGYWHFYKQRIRSEDCRIFKSLRLFNCFWKKKMSDSEEDNVLERIEAAAQEAVSNLIPQKSRVAYETTYSRFEEWRSKQKVICCMRK